MILIFRQVIHRASQVVFFYIDIYSSCAETEINVRGTQMCRASASRLNFHHFRIAFGCDLCESKDTSMWTGETVTVLHKMHQNNQQPACTSECGMYWTFVFFFVCHSRGFSMCEHKSNITLAIHFFCCLFCFRVSFFMYDALTGWHTICIKMRRKIHQRSRQNGSSDVVMWKVRPYDAGQVNKQRTQDYKRLSVYI